MFNNKFRILTGIILLLILAVRSQKTPKLNIDVLYESLCPDSLNFINEQLYPVWPEIAPFVNLKFVPFGKSQSLRGGEDFICQHGPNECIGNRLQSCALKDLTDSNAQVEFVHCFMNTFGKRDVGQMCAKQVGLQWNDIYNCYYSDMGKSLQLEAESLTRKISPTFVPTILYNGAFDQKSQDMSLRHFKAVVCMYLNRITPEICT